MTGRIKLNVREIEEALLSYLEVEKGLDTQGMFLSELKQLLVGEPISNADPLMDADAALIQIGER